MDEHATQTMSYDVRRCWERDRRIHVRPLVRADLPGLARLHEDGRNFGLVTCDGLARFAQDDAVAWALERQHALIGVVAATRSEERTTTSAHPWSEASRDALEDTALPCLELGCARWADSVDVDAPAILRDTVCNAVQGEPFAEVRVACRIRADESSPAARLMTLHAGFEQARWDRTPIAVFLRAGFQLQGWYHDSDGDPVARLNWVNRAR